VEISRNGGQVQVRRCTTSKQADQYTLVLTAMGMNTVIAPTANSTRTTAKTGDVQNP